MGWGSGTAGRGPFRRRPVGLSGTPSGEETGSWKSPLQSSGGRNGPPGPPDEALSGVARSAFPEFRIFSPLFYYSKLLDICQDLAII